MKKMGWFITALAILLIGFASAAESVYHNEFVRDHKHEYTVSGQTVLSKNELKQKHLNELKLIIPNISSWAEEFAKKKKITTTGNTLAVLRFSDGYDVVYGRGGKDDVTLIKGWCVTIGNRFYIHIGDRGDWETLFHEYGHGLFGKWVDHGKFGDEEDIMWSWEAFCENKFDDLKDKAKKESKK